MWKSEDFDEVLRPRLKYLGSQDPIPTDVPLRDLGLESMESVQLLFDLEDKFDAEMPDSLLVPKTFETVGSLKAAVMAFVSG